MGVQGVEGEVQMGEWKGASSGWRNWRGARESKEGGAVTSVKVGTVGIGSLVNNE